MIYDYLYEIGYHKQFRSSLYDKQNKEDAALQKEFIDFITNESLKSMKDHFKANPDMLSTPTSDCISKMFADVPQIPQYSENTMKFTRPSNEEKIKWQSRYVENLKGNLREALSDLEKMENES